MSPPNKKSYSTYGRKSPTQLSKEKSAQIQKIIKDKEVSISVSAARRDAAMWVMNHPEWKNPELTDKDRIEWIEKITQAFIRFYAGKLAEHSVLYQEIKNAEQEKLQKVAKTTEFDVPDKKS